MQSISKTLKSDYNLFAKAVELKIDSFKVVVLFQLRLKIPRELLNPDFITDFVLGFFNSVREPCYSRCGSTLFGNPVIEECDLVVRLNSSR